MPHSKLAYSIIGISVVGAVLWGGLVPGAVLGFAALLLIGAYRRYTRQDGEGDTVRKTASAKTQAGGKGAAKPSVPKQPDKPKPVAGTPPVKPAKPARKMNVSPVSAKNPMKPSVWKNPPRK